MPDLPDNLRPVPKPGIMEGNPIDGVIVYGPFEDRVAAIEWATNNCTGDWWDILIQSPEGGSKYGS